MMKARSRVVLGSLVGAVAIHLAMIACSSSGGTISMLDGGSSDVPSAADVTGTDTATLHDVQVSDSGFFDSMVDAVRDALGDVVAAETSDARAQTDSGTPTCMCPLPPAPPTTTFSFLVNNHDGMDPHPLAAGPHDLTQAFIAIRAIPNTVAVPVAYDVRVWAVYPQPDLFTGAHVVKERLQCEFTMVPPSTVIGTTTCMLNGLALTDDVPAVIDPNGGGPIAPRPAPNVTTLTATDADLTVHFAPMDFYSSSGMPPILVSLTNVSFHTNAPAGGLLAVPGGSYVAP